MKLLIAVVHDQCSTKLTEQLTAAGYRSTKLSSTGGFLRAGNTTLLIGVQPEEVDGALDIIKTTCKSGEQLTMPAKHSRDPIGAESALMKMSSGGGVVFVLDADQLRQVINPPRT